MASFLNCYKSGVYHKIKQSFDYPVYVFVYHHVLKSMLNCCRQINNYEYTVALLHASNSDIKLYQA